MLGQILVAIDGSKNSVRATDLARELREHCGGRLILVYAFPAIPHFLGQKYMLDLAARHRIEAERVMKEASAPLQENGTPFETEILEGPAAEAILNVAEVRECDLIIIGAKGYTNLEAHLIGSVSDRVVKHAKCPVLVVK